MAERTNHEEMRGSSAVQHRSNGGETSRTEHIRREIEETRASLDHKLDALGTKVREVQTRARETFDVNHQIAAHPWAAFGTAIAAGYLLGSMGSDRDDDYYRPYSMPGDWHVPAAATGMAAGGGMLHSVGERMTDAAQRFTSGMQDAAAKVSSGMQSAAHLVSERAQHVAHSVSRDPRRNDIVESLKLAAGAAVTDMLREGIRRYMPALGEQLDRVWQEKGLTPTKAASALFGGLGGHSSGSEHSHQSAQGSTGYGSTGGSSRPDMAQDYNPTVEPHREASVRGEVTSRS